MKSIIKSNKHYVHTSTSSVTSGSLATVTIANAVATPSAATQVEEGSVIKAVFVELWVNTATANLATAVSVMKLSAGSSAPTYAESIALDAYNGKKDILENHQGLVPSDGSTIPVFRHWIRIPKGKQRFGLNDKFILNISGIGGTVNYCGFYSYKEYS